MMNEDHGAQAGARTASPCRRLCTLDEHDVCVGCGRTITEICTWSALDEPGRVRVCADAAARLAARERRVR
jgi:uncharacterized protein